MNDEENKFFISQKTLVIVILTFVALLFCSIIIKTVIAGHL
ncbi:MAG: hypothetical protein OEZ55_01665 [Nitrospinota bacterium]|nr:hypothetical protein [Nitrospinota bacterium]MDH5755361.1 hypothetical protein [Nitrospinota bacterium]